MPARLEAVTIAPGSPTTSCSRIDESPDRTIAAGKRLLGARRPERVGGEVVVGEVEEEEVEAVAGDEPASDGRRVGVDRADGPSSHRKRRSRHVRREEVVVEEAERAVDGPHDAGNR